MAGTEYAEFEYLGKGTEAPPPGEVSDAVGRLNKVVGEAHALLERLADRITPVLLVPPADQSANPESGYTVGVAKEIGEDIDSLVRLCDKLGDLYRRVSI